MEFMYDGAFSFPSYVNSIVTRNDCCNLLDGHIFKWKMALDAESPHMYPQKPCKPDYVQWHTDLP